MRFAAGEPSTRFRAPAVAEQLSTNSESEFAPSPGEGTDYVILRNQVAAGGQTWGGFAVPSRAFAMETMPTRLVLL